MSRVSATGTAHSFAHDANPTAASLLAFVQRHPRLLVLTGAGCSTDSGIPDYRDADGAWKRPRPVDHRDFVADPAVRRRYWARSLIGWRHFGAARPNAAHLALARLEALGHVARLVTQNVDGLHAAAGSRAVIDLHGRLDQVVCLDCGHRLPRAVFQRALADANPAWASAQAAPAPDGDAELDGADFSAFTVPACSRCGGRLKPDVVFFGDNVPLARVRAATDALAQADALLVVGSSLMVYSGFRFARKAAERGQAIAILNRGRTRADALATLKLDAAVAPALTALVQGLASTGTAGL
ncbi:NAD-dependent protein deacetylase [Verticiella sediminum]|uniref:NAD-dependent protein deacetylase n=1 Tax=Verticiella sediminum TaxID=1247510 RepID=A0A556A7I9_9BURK|nr:NAD-dependent protein deacetylase [Verticiella sediminum]TSH88840.1 NAD-dependent protein deacetylase [Verticiella sediminum]